MSKLKLRSDYVEEQLFKAITALDPKREEQIQNNLVVLKPIYMELYAADSADDMQLLQKAWENALPGLEPLIKKCPEAVAWFIKLKDCIKEKIIRRTK